MGPPKMACITSVHLFRSNQVSVWCCVYRFKRRLRRSSSPRPLGDKVKLLPDRQHDPTIVQLPVPNIRLPWPNNTMLRLGAFPQGYFDNSSYIDLLIKCVRCHHVKKLTFTLQNEPPMSISQKEGVLLFSCGTLQLEAVQKIHRQAAD